MNEIYWKVFTPDFGRPAYSPKMMFKKLYLQFLYNL
ncbi:MAG: transposase [Dehalococcoidia bacterium]|nr:MAG: transposase [Dehalococcoidia bacterium]